MIVKDIDRGWKRIKKQALSHNNAVKIGVRGSGTGSKNISAIATYHEKGGKNNRPPKRSFIASTIDGNVWIYQRALDKAADKILSGSMSKNRALRQIGLLLVRNIKKRIRSGISPELAESTKKRKAKHGGAKNTPLIWTGRLINSITHWLE